ncbi:hypothetical protein PSCICE_03100 [Pseudomonas cichorii]|nr:hypothetical protein PSCICE_03100 [Pseudomonas cichorii]
MYNEKKAMSKTDFLDQGTDLYMFYFLYGIPDGVATVEGVGQGQLRVPVLIQRYQAQRRKTGL